MAVSIKFSREEDISKILTFEKNANEITLKDVRARLVSEKFFNDEAESKKYRYVYPTVEIDEDEDYVSYSDRVLGLTSEKDITVEKMFLKTGSEVVLTNVYTEDTERANLIGFRTGFWSSNNLQVSCRLRPGYNATNTPEPFLLNDVITSRDKDYSKVHIPNVLVCVQGSVIEFPVACKCTVGMVYSVWENGQRIFDYASPLPPYVSNAVAYGCVFGYNNGEYSNERQGPKAIVADKLSSLDMTSKEAVSFDITITASDVTQWTEMENSIAKATYTKDSVSPLKLKFAKSLEVPSGNSSAAMKSEQVVVDNKSYFLGKIIPGQDVPKLMPGVHTFRVDKIGETLGSMRVSVLVFKSMEIAQKYVARYNALN